MGLNAKEKNDKYGESFRREMKTKDMVYPREILATNFPPEIVYLSLLDHFTSRKDVKVKRYTEPSHL